jgi:tripartite-type tricarboxylate transporter receptor subunit TctC
MDDLKRLALRLALAVLSSTAVLQSAPALAQAWPSKPVHIIIPTAAGGATDVLTRLLTAQYEKRYGQPFVIEFRPGALSQIGTEAVVKSPPDGYTFLSTSTQIVSEEALNPAWTIRFERDVTAVSLFVGGAIAIVSSTKLPVNTLAELVAYAKANPGKLNQAESGGISTDLAIFKHRLGLRSETILYKGAQASIQAVATGEADFYGATVLDALPLEKAGRLKILAYGERSRHPMLPQTPTVNEALNIDWFDGSFWFFLGGPAGLPRDIVTSLHAATQDALRAPEVAQRIATFGMRPLDLTPEQTREQIVSRIRLLQKMVAEGVKLR